MNFSINDSVRLESFFGTKSAANEVNEKQNYWKLIGLVGRVIRKREIYHLAHKESQLQLLVQFDDAVEKHELYCLNDDKNAFWILHSDLILIETENSA